MIRKKEEKIQLTDQQIEQVWNFAKTIDGKDPQTIRQDILGAIIHKKDYNNGNTDFGWCAEYVLSPTLLESYNIPSEHAFCEENIRVLHVRNYYANTDEPIGHYKALYRPQFDSDSYNRWQKAWQISDIIPEGIEMLQQKFNLSDELVHEIFAQYLNE